MTVGRQLTSVLSARRCAKRRGSSIFVCACNRQRKAGRMRALVESQAEVECVCALERLREGMRPRTSVLPTHEGVLAALPFVHVT